MKLGDKLFYGLLFVGVGLLIYNYKDKIFSKIKELSNSLFDTKEEEDSFNIEYANIYKNDRKPFHGDLLSTDYSRLRCFAYEFSVGNISKPIATVEEYASKLKWNKIKLPNCELPNDVKIAAIDKNCPKGMLC